MPDYGHELTFGSFLTPTNEQPLRAVGLAQLSEELGLDLVSFQDHPYQPGFLDTATLLAFVAARTVDIRLAPNVANLPLRPPAVLARSIASLDLLTGGRVELGIGAGAFWEAIEAMGGRRLAGGAAVQALGEAIDVIRAVWDTSSRGGVRVEGAHYRVVGMKRGPAPAHPIGIWVGAYKPRMLALTGRKGDGWLPSLSYLKDGDLAAGNAVIDEAAVAAGRTPSDVRRLLNITGRFQTISTGLLQGSAEQWAEELADLATTDGISTFILGSDDPEDLRRFAAEVAPAVRELVDAQRASAPVPPAEPEPLPTPEQGVAGTSRAPFAVVPTTDDGSRRSTERVWDEATRPSGPSRDPQRAYTAQEQAAGQHLVDVHDAMRAELAQLHELVAQVGRGETHPAAVRSHISRMTVRQNEWVLGAYCANYCRIVTTHHTIEDQSMFPHLRRAEPALGPVVDRLQEEHQVIHHVLELVDKALVDFVTVPDGGVGLREAVDLLDDTLLSHFAYEERELVEPLARLGFS